MIAIAIVAIAADFGPADGVSWIISAMYITTAVCAPMAGRLGSIFGARRVFMAGLVFVAAGSVVGVFAPNVAVLTVAYVLIGTGISVHTPNAMTMLRAYAERYDRSPRTAIATLVMCGQSTAALGPTVGGLLVGAFGWQSILWVNLPVTAICAVWVMRADVGFAGGSEDSTFAELRGLDFAGIGLFVVGLTSLMLFLISLRGAPYYWALPIAVVAVALFIVRERRADEPFIDVRALADNGALSATLVRALLTYVCFYCVFFGIPQWLQTVRGMTPIQAGLTMLPVAGVGVLATAIGSRTYRRYGIRATLFVGTLALVIGGLLIAAVEKSTAPVVVLLIVAAVLGIPNGFNNIGNQSLINTVTSVDNVGASIGMYRTVAFIGANLSIVVTQLLSGGVMNDDGMKRVGWFIAIVGAVLLVAVLRSRHMGDAKKPATSGRG
ncbi:MFS transporter [Gordonia sp. zg691]|uniref:MFS transporter n=2 Tax=Gordonia jinghuaiqii TaxID=2758710 RepID=A0A7D7LUW4_9ACTN|nr:MFS transporter [Gordonia jinghuaiqii]MCR5979178.1 MFS transporter [Gordonia jinghuaiqii]QMT04025.1 MFS transporter [Gordonia jinghuaiqii]